MNRNRFLTPTVFCLAAISAACAGCADKKIVEIQADAPKGPVSLKEPFFITPKALNKKQQPIAEVSFGFLSSSPEVASVSTDGAVICHRSGVTNIVVTAGGVNGTYPVTCQIVERLQVPAALMVVVGDEAMDPGVLALGADGVQLDLPIDLICEGQQALVCADGKLEGRAQGQATVTARSGGVDNSFEVQVVEVGAIECESPLLVRVDDALLVPATVYAIDGSLIDLEPTFEVEDTSVARVVLGNVLGQKYGLTQAMLRAGKASRAIEIAVYEDRGTSPLLLNDGEREAITLNTTGYYMVDVQVSASDGTGYGVTARWLGASCPGSTEAQRMRLKCAVDRSVTLLIENPTTFGMGPSADGQYTLYRSPVEFP